MLTLPTARLPCWRSIATGLINETLIHKFNGGPVGLSSLAVAVGEEAGTIEEVNEPYLIMEGYIKRTPQGRVATANAYRKLGLKPPAGAQAELFGQLCRLVGRFCETPGRRR